MPQMSPLNWMILFIYFSILLFLFSLLTYFSFIPKMPKKLNKQIFPKSFNWKW
uniref:ATP synthase complex subunit 8 n=1 Tax=Paradyschiria parvula TaxID=2572155 RepID=A0A5B9RGM3_9MUSC|nr:ATP synthase F0 subunit 8 [Paradyschiria parvula]QEG77634.1 ATP synthase F0 subunit 8 [Paradyschiria parvula]